METLNKHIDDGIKYFQPVKPSEWTPAHTVFLKRFLEYVEKKRQLEEKQKQTIRTAEQIFKNE